MNNFIISLTSSSFFASRAFLTTLLFALCFRFPHIIPFNSTEFTNIPLWFTSNVSILILSILAGVEVLGEKNSDVRELISYVDKPVKTVASLFVNYLLMTPENAAVIQTVQQSGFGVTSLLSIFPAVIVYSLSTIRTLLYEQLKSVDESDDFKAQFAMSIIEDFWVVFGVVFLIVLPLLVFVMVGVITFVFVMMKRKHDKEEDAKKIVCPHCKTSIFPSSTICYKCSETLISPTKIGFFGQIKIDPIEYDKRENQKIVLLNYKRCPICSTKLRMSNVIQRCSCCGHSLSVKEFQDLISYKDREFTIGLLITFLIGLLPVIGMVISIVYIKWNFVKPYKQFIPTITKIFSKWSLRVIMLCLVIVQPFPFLGYISAPITLVIFYTFWKKKLKEELLKSNREANLDVLH